MKKFTLFLLGLITVLSASAQMNFTWEKNEVCPGSNLKAMASYEDTAFIVGYDRNFFKSADAGASWEYMDVFGIIYDFGDMSIADDGTGYAGSGDPKVFDNPSGGETDVYTPGQLLKTTDAGLTWTIVDISSIGSGEDPATNPNVDGCYTMHFYSIDVLNADTAFLGLQWYWWDDVNAKKITYNGDFWTTDGGTTWVNIDNDHKMSIGISNDGNYAYFSGSSRLQRLNLATGVVEDIYANVSTPADDLTIYIYDITPTNIGEIILSTTGNGYFFSTDNGNSFTQNAGTDVPSGGYDAVRVNDSTIVSIGASGKTAVTTDNGTSWTDIYPGSTAYEAGEVFNDSLYALAAGKIFKIALTDLATRTNNWKTQDLTSYTERLHKMHMIDANTAVIAGYDETIIKTTDGGLTWELTNMPELNVTEYPEYDWEDVEITGDGTVFASTRRLYFINYPSGGPTDVYGHSIIAKSKNFGKDWLFLDYRNIGNSDTDPANNPYLADACYGATVPEIEPVSNTMIYAYISWYDTIGGTKTQHGKIFKTTDGGNIWAPISGDFGSKVIYEIHFTDGINGYIAGNTTFEKTTDGGTTWTDEYAPIGEAHKAAGEDSTAFINAAEFVSEQEWYLSTYDGVFFTTDGGTSYSLLGAIGAVGSSAGVKKIGDNTILSLKGSSDSKVTFDGGTTWNSCYPGSTIYTVGDLFGGNIYALAKGKFITLPEWNLDYPAGTDILSFVMTEQTGDAVINSDDHTVAIEVAEGTDPASLKPVLELSNGATATPDTSAAQDFTNAVTYTVTGWDGETQDWTVSVTVYVGIETDLASGISIFPNPAKNKLEISGLENMESVSISSITGMKLMEINAVNKEKLKLDLSDMNNGIYFISFRDMEGSIATRKFIKN